MSTENQEFENQALEDTMPEPTVDTQEMTDESFDETDKVSQECRMWQDKYVRLSAEFDNYRKRTLKEKMDLVETGGQNVISGIIHIVDDLQRAVEHMQKREDIASETQGVQLILTKFMDALKAKGVTTIDAMGKEFDVDFHEAIAKVPVTDPALKGKVMDVVQCGYMLGQKVLRFAKVVVGE